MEAGLVVTSVLVAATNAAVICMVIFIKELRTFTNYFVVSLAVADFLTGAVLVPVTYSWNFGPGSGGTGPRRVVSSYFMCVIVLSGVANLCAVTWDRYIAITDPFSYKNKLKRYWKKILIAIWMTAILISLIPHSMVRELGSVEHKVFLIVFYVVLVIIPYVFIAVAYVRIWLRLRSHAAELKKMGITNETREGARKASLESKTVKVFLVVMAVFLLSWLPSMYITITTHVFGRPDLVPRQLKFISIFTIDVSSLVDPILYALLKRDFKALIQRIRIPRVGQQSSSMSLPDHTKKHCVHSERSASNCPYKESTL